MNIEKLLDELYSYSLHGIKLGLQNIEKICMAMGNPERDYKVIHVAGTNGKGSTSTTIERVLLEYGKTVGKYTSPHILRFNERICANGREISDSEVAYYYSYVKGIIEEIGITPTFFEVTTAMMFKYFSDKKVEYVILEVGMGGKYDATNVVDAEICIITNVSLDHTEFLGKTIYDIACEKAGIIKKNSKVIVGSSDSEFIKAIEEKTSTYTNVILKYEDATHRLDFEKFRTYIDIQGENYEYSLFGEYQYKNFLCALEVLKILNVPEDIIKKGMTQIIWQCRFEIIQKEKLIILDGAHNEDGVKTLCETLKKGYKSEEIVSIVSILKDKDSIEIIKILENYVEDIIFTSLSENKRGQSGKELYENFANKKNKTYCEDIRIAYENAKNKKNKKVILVCGSFYLLSKFKEEVLKYEI
ncbi:folylpolyglutamate synthase/dihydrofolate synthase family protein [uncultured Cetobacterium sp.]|uniref:bifunctional folylpolyglutamate synthase/dihydrofolate synthase n=1 Tax=uncultured Cetobacterium sp. TaxID=527638 RepID=UPI00261796B2|nr:folylpolyglutamate synthase/dihydrofolate synthase family protein [uncultured Cetobacterium sp.]